MTIEASLFYEVTDTAAIVALIEDRFYPAGGVPSSVDMPYATYQEIDDIPVHHQSGICDLRNARYQIDCWADSQLASSNVGAAFRAAFDRYSGDMGETGNTTTVRCMTLESQRQDSFSPTDASQRTKYRKSMDFIIWFRP